MIENEKTSGEVLRATMELLRDAGKTPVHVRRDVPGFVGNRLQHALKREAIALVAAGVCDAETIDIVVKEGPGARMAVLGPMEQSDLVGLDLTLEIAECLYADLDRTAGPHAFLRKKVSDGKLGMKTGEDPALDRRECRRGPRAPLLFLVQQAKARRSDETLSPEAHDDQTTIIGLPGRFSHHANKPRPHSHDPCRQPGASARIEPIHRGDRQRGQSRSSRVRSLLGRLWPT